MINRESPAICPECESQLDWYHQYDMARGIGEGAVRFWACQNCRHTFKTKGGQIIE